LFDNFEFKTIASDKKRYTIQCITADGCLWRLHASLIASDNGDTTIVEIKTLVSEHTCNGIHTARHRQASASFVSSVIEGRLRDQLGYRPTEVLRDIRRDHGVEISYSTAWRAKEQATANINGSHEDAYQQLPQYCEDILRNNPGSTVTLEHTEDNQFKRVFISYAASGMGFAHCRPVIGLDGAHLKGKYFGILLSATAVDANGSLFPLAFAVVDAENDDNWA
jgi:MuDR family transposase/MULE transposase domain